MDSATLSEKITARTEEIQLIIDKFVSKWNGNPGFAPIKVIDGAAEKISTVYFHLIHETVKGHYLKEDGFVNRFKVASGTEIACMLVNPIRFEDTTSKYNTESDKSKLNARFATTAAFQMLYSIHFDNESDYLGIAKNERTVTALKNHTDWLRFFDYSNSYPIFLNSIFWEMYMSALLLENSK